MRARVGEVAGLFLAGARAVDGADAVPDGHVRALAEAGLYGAFAPAEVGGLGMDFPAVCAAIEELASGCLASTFVWIQHFGLLRTLLDPGTPEPLRAMLPGAVHGEVRGGLALAGLLPGAPRLTARPADGGWVLDGQAPWVSGWGQVQILLVTARGPDDGSVVTFLLDAAGQPGLAAEPLRLAAANASGTVRLSFTGVFVPGSRYVGGRPFDPVRQQAEGLRSNGSLALGVGRRCCALIGPSALDAELGQCRAALDAAGDATMPAARARASEFAVRAAHLLAVRHGSASALAGDDAERLTREAAFLLVFGSRPAIKEALLGRLTASVG